MGFAASGYYLNRLQELLGRYYNVRNFGVGGESSTIMCRQGSDSIIFPFTFTLPADISRC